MRGKFYLIYWICAWDREFGSWRCQICIPPKKFTDRKITSFIYFAFLKVYLMVWLLLGFICQFSAFSSLSLWGWQVLKGVDNILSRKLVAPFQIIWSEPRPVASVRLHVAEEQVFQGRFCFFACNTFWFTSLSPIYPGFTSSEAELQVLRFWGLLFH